ncbi:hypothetical protein HA466_0277250 [Hirschfeldia incana]|nr:hypothetical protein HA466_0277250 [Hirschfeldia incana]
MNLHLKKELVRSSLQKNRLRSPLRMLTNLSIGEGNNENRSPAADRNRDDDVSEESPKSVIGNEDVNRS